MEILKINVGCGTDYRDGFVNIDGNDTLSKVDKIINIPKETLNSYFGKNRVDYLLVNDFIEHHFHWEAVKILNDFYNVLKNGGILELRAPDSKYIMKTWKLSIEKKLILLFGGQDINQGKNIEMDKSRKKYPQFFCHKFGWTQSRMKGELKKIGFEEIKMKRASTNFIVIAKKGRFNENFSHNKI